MSTETREDQAWERAYRAGTLNVDQARYFGTKPYEELYDLNADPDQVRNLAGMSAQRTRQRAFARALDRHILETRDNGFIPEGMPPEGYHASCDGAAYPLAKVMALAEAAARRDPVNLASFQAGLSEANPVLRYSAAMGLLILGPHAAPATDGLGKLMREDPIPQNRVVAAEAMAGLSPKSEAVLMLGALTRLPLAWPVRLQALNALTALGGAARPALADIEACGTADQEYLRSAGRYLTQVLNGTYTPG